MSGKILYWRGCMSRLRTKHIADSTEELLRRLGIDYETLEDEGCCGSVLLRTGQVDDAYTVAKMTADQIRSRGFTEVVTSCPGCFRTMSSEYHELVGDVPFKVRHISQFLFDYSKELKKHLRPMKVKVMYHDPCHLGRHMGVYEEPRKLIRLVPSVELMEFKYNRGKALCCGSGGGVRSVFPEITLEVARTVLNERQAGVKILITSCPFCNYNFMEAGGANIEVIDLPEFLLRAWRES
jgi:heterodisulfide reductase subunit D